VTLEREAEIEKNYVDLCQMLYDWFYRWHIANQFTSMEEEDRIEPEIDYSSLTTQEIMDKIKDFVASDPKDNQCMIFLEYFAKFPVSMCKRTVSPLLKKLIGFHYHLGLSILEANKAEGATLISYDDLAELFVRSKATIHECVHDTELAWKQIQAEIGQENLREKAKAIALEDMIEEEKELLRSANKGTIKQMNEQP
jgi:hypothetical protein